MKKNPSKIKKILSSIYFFIMGKHPHSTIFSYNYYYVRTIMSFFKKLVSNFNKTEKKTIIDVGGGISPYFMIFQNISEKYYVVDFKSALPKNEERNIIQIEGTAEKLNFKSNYADIILSNQVLEHVNDERLAVKETYRVLKKGGVFAGSLPHISPIHLEPYDYRRFTSFGIIKLLKDAGFTNIKIENSGGVYNTVAYLILTNWFLYKNKGKNQKFNIIKHFLFSPITFFINITSIIADKIFQNKHRSPANYCWSAEK